MATNRRGTEREGVGVRAGESAAGEERLMVHTMFQEQAERTPSSVAVAGEGGQLTYRELDLRTNQLARHLMKLGVGPEVAVGISLERSPEMITALFGVLKAGGAYVPLDPAYPKERLSAMIGDSGIRVLLTQERLADVLPHTPAAMVCLDSEWEKIAEESDGSLASAAKPENLAYIIYTSGSTGKPKGVMIQHSSLGAYLRAMNPVLEFDAADRMMQFASLNFDASVLEIFCTLTSGATLVLRSETMLSSAADFLAACREKSITAMLLPTAFWHMLTLEIWEHKLEIPLSLRLVVVGGEKALAERLTLWLKSVPQRVRLLNAYGPTETTVAATVSDLRQRTEDQEREGLVPIGRPLPGVRAYVVGRHGRLVGKGETGELWLGGFGVSRGYLNLPEQTSLKFVPDPFRDGVGLVYRTGDLVRALPDGNLDFIGRTDHQVKIRGYRIELGEVEAALNKLEHVRQSVVVVREDRTGDKRLVAYLVPSSGHELAIGAVRAALKDGLPEYMMPASFVMLDSLPLTPAGKVDRNALPPPEPGRGERVRPFVAPRTAVEQGVAKIWGDLLGLREVGMEDPFLEVGGHSLAAAQLIARLRDAFQVELTLRFVFEHPTVASMADFIERGKAQASDFGGPARHRAPRGADLPLSFSQEAVWFFLRLHPLNVAYNSQAYLRLRGPLSVDALRLSLNELVRRHEIFRTTFHDVGGRPVQRIHPPYEYPLAMKNLEPVPEAVRETEAQNIIRLEVGTPFELTKLPLVRWTLLRLSDHEHILILVEHHFVHDGWSFNLLLGELKALYAAFVAHQPSPLEEPPIQFADFVVWQRLWMESDEAQRHIEYWKNRLAGSPPLLELPTDRPRPTQLSLHGAALRIDLDPALYAALRKFSRDEGTSLFMTMLAAFLTLLHRQSGMDDFCIGCGVANRRHKETEKVLGMIVNTVAIRTQMAGNPTFRDFLAQIRETAIAALAHQDIPFEKVVEAIQPKRSLSYLPIYQVMFGFHDSPATDMEFSGLSSTLMEGVSNSSAKTDLNVIVIPRSEQHVGQDAPENAYRLTVNWEYNSELFDRASMQRMLGQFQMILAGAVANPATRLWELPLLSRAERAEICESWGKARREYPADGSIPGLFEQQVGRAPDAVAIVNGQERLTYRELNEKANQLAHRLRSAGVKRGVPVGLFMERSTELLVAILGILKAGGAYLPLDPALPEERLRFVVHDGKFDVLLTSDHLHERVSWFQGECLRLSRGCPEITEEPFDNPVHDTGGTDLAYVMYTSGSTGSPKGVGVEHRGIVRLVKNQNYAELGPGETFLQFAPIHFDASTFEVWGSLLNGGRLVVCPVPKPSIRELAETIEREGVTTLWLTAALFEQMIDEALDHLQGVHQLLAGGDVLSAPHVRKFLARYPGSRLVNGYGPTENTTFTTCHVMRNDGDVDAKVPIGRPIANTEVYILDRTMQAVPAGVIGELYAGGDGLARGYFNRPDLTAEKFVPNPLGTPGSRLYRTGDLCRYDAGGRIEFIGRTDHQVKVRGYRIELGEVESALRRCPGVKDAVVKVDDTSGARRLIAYCVPHGAIALEGAELRALLAKMVPEYMVPAAIAILPSLPLTPTGKVDRNALPSVLPEGSMEKGTGDFAPRSTMEKLVAKIWSDILHAENIGVHDNFFDLGGHSLLATQVVSRLVEATGVEISLARFFETPTIAGLSLLYEERLLHRP